MSVMGVAAAAAMSAARANESSVGRFANERVAGGRHEQRHRRDGADGDAGALDALPAGIEIDAGADVDDGDVHLVAGDETMEEGAGVGRLRRDVHLHDELTGAEDVLAGAGEKVLEGEVARAVRGAERERGAKGDKGGDGVGGGTAVADVPTEAGAALDLDPADKRRAVDDAGQAADDFVVLVDLGEGHGRADLESTVVGPGIADELGDVLDVDELVDLFPALAELDDDVGTASEEGRGLAVREGGVRLAKRGGRQVVDLLHEQSFGRLGG